MTHLRDWELIQIIEEGADANATEHLGACSSCANELTDLREFFRGLADPSVHREAATPRVSASDRVEDARQIMREIIDGNHRAEVFMAGLRDRPVPEWLGLVAREEPTEGVIRCLAREARDRFERAPEEALLITDAARSLASRLSDPTTIAVHRSVISKERANALRMLGRYDEALEELSWAERFLAHVPLHEYDLAFIDWTRAAILLHMTRYDEALLAARRAIGILELYGETWRAEQVRIIEAGVLYEQGDVNTALATYHRLEAFFSDTDDVLTRARIGSNIAECTLRLGDVEEARRHAHGARALFRSLNNETEEVRVSWILAHALVRQADPSALLALNEVRERFLALGMRGEAAGALLDIAEVHVRARAWDEALRVATTAASEFTTLNAPVHIAEACEYLRQAVAGRSASPAVVQYVSAYVRAGAPNAFLPPS